MRRKYAPRIVGWSAAAVLILLPAVALAADLTLKERLAESLRGHLTGGQVIFALGIALVGGFLTSLTPCVWPLIPITVRYFGAMKASRARSLSLALLYVLGMIVLYAVLGTAFAASGAVFGTFLASPWVVGAIALFCIAMGASMLGAFTMQLPASLNTKLSQAGGQSPGGAVAMGLVSGLIAAPCTGPVLLVILAVIASTGELFIGFWLMVAFGTGLGIPFLFLAIFSSAVSRIPGSGNWMEAVKGVLAVGMFVVAVYFLRFAIPPLEAALHAWPELMPAAVAVPLVFILMIGGTLLMFITKNKGLRLGAIGAATVGLSLFLFGAGQVADDSGVPHIAWVPQHDAGVTQARAEGRPVMIDFTAEWCQACKELDRETYVDVEVRKEAARFVNLKIDATDIDDEMDALFEKYSILGLPTVIFIDSGGQTLEDPRVTGFVPPQRFKDLMAKVQ